VARIFITGSSDGLGLMAAKQLILDGHHVVLHARNVARGQEALASVPGAETVLIGDLSDMKETRQLAADVNALENFDAIIHNAGVYHASAEQIFAVNTLAPYLLTCLIRKPERLIYLSSGMHLQGDPNLKKLRRKSITYSDSKLHVVMLILAVARLWPTVFANAVDPGWVPTKMGGAGAPDDLEKGYKTQTWLATSDDAEACVSGHYFYHQKQSSFAKEAEDLAVQNEFLSICEEFTGVTIPK